MADYPVSITQLSTSDAKAQAIADIVGELRDEAIKQTAAQQLIALGLSGGTGEVKEWKALRNVLRSGLIRKLLAVGDQLLVEKESGLSVTVNGNVTAATVNEETFVAANGPMSSFLMGLHGTWREAPSSWHIMALRLPAHRRKATRWLCTKRKVRSCSTFSILTMTTL